MQIHSKKNLKTNMENYSWEIVQNMIEREVNAAFKLRVDPEYKLKENLNHIVTIEDYSRWTITNRRVLK